MTARILHDLFRHIALLQGRQASLPARIRQGGLQTTVTIVGDDRVFRAGSTGQPVLDVVDERARPVRRGLPLRS